MKKSLLFLFLALLLITGCQSSSSQQVSNNHPLEPQLIISSLKKNGELINGNLRIIETNSFYKNVKFSNFQLNSDDCEINKFNPIQNTISSGDNLIFDANISCNNYPSNLELSFDETAQYIDTSIKTVKKHFTKDIEIKSPYIGTNIGLVSIQPSSVSVKEGDSFTFYVYTFDVNNSPISTEVKINPPVDNNGNIVGEFDKYFLTTDTNGKGSFTYKAPSNINTDTINLTVPVIIDNEITKYIHIEINKNKETIVNPTKLILVPKSISVNAGVSYKIQILTLDDDNRGISSTVTISHPIDNNNNSWGDFDKYTLTTDDNGEGEVIFTAADDLSKVENNLSVKINVPSAGLTQNLLLIKPTSSKKEEASYEIKYSVPNSVEIEKDFSINIQILNKQNEELVNDNNISEINLTSENHLIYFEHNSSEYRANIKEKNNINIPATTKTTSGIDIIDVNATVKSGNKVKTISQQIPVVVISGPVRAISINPIGSKYNSDTGLFEHDYSIHAVDKYSNPVQAGTKITVGAVVNPKIYSQSGQLSPIAGSDTSKFTDSNQSFDNDLIKNTLIIFADNTHTDPLYLGGWIIDNVEDTHTLTLSSAYNGDTQNNLHYVIGDEKRYNSCEDTLAVADFDSSDKTYTTDSSGIAIVKLRFDPYLIGKTISLYANSYQDERVGISKKEILLNNELLTYESGEDNGSNVNHHDGIWEKTGSKDDNVTGTITIGVNGGATINSILNENSPTTLMKNTSITLTVLTPSVCTIDKNQTKVTLTTNCNGTVSFDVNFSNDGECDIAASNINYEY